MAINPQLIARLQVKIARLIAQIGGLRSTTLTQAEAIDFKTTENASLAQANTDLSFQVSVLATQLADAIAAAGGFQSQIAQLFGELQTAQANDSLDQATIADINARLLEATTANEASQSAIIDLSAQLDAKTTELADSQVAFQSQLEAVSTEAEANVAVLNEQIATDAAADAATEAELEALAADEEPTPA
jgi:chromosome segregation ATPase